MTLTRWVHLGICCPLTKHKTFTIVGCRLVSQTITAPRRVIKSALAQSFYQSLLYVKEKYYQKADGAVHINAAWKNWGNWKVSVEFCFDFLFIYLNSLGESFQLQPTVPARRSQVRNWEPGILWSLHKGRTAAVRGQSMCSTHRYCSYVCAQTFQRGLHGVHRALNSGAEGHSQQNICKLYLRLDFDKHIILHIFQFITILCKRQLWRGWNLCWLVCFCKSDIFIPALTGMISGRKNSLTSDVAVEGGKRNVCC